ncbi:MAG TPA: iron ABC transporter permease [Acidobacteriota bacterium]|nr:iron ABC transporter permease [Acidobacteriota bacterium]HND18324.1 iron ABC transporter permease [Acidobacteriota bacterium]
MDHKETAETQNPDKETAGQKDKEAQKQATGSSAQCLQPNVFSPALEPGTRWFFPIAIFILVVAIIAGIGIGSVTIAPDSVVRIIASHVLPAGWVDVTGIRDVDVAVVWLIRTPRVLVAVLVGAGLAIAGAQMQGLFQNPLASPDIIGTSSGGALGAVIALATGLATRSLWYMPILAFLGALVSLFVVYAISTQRGRTPVSTLLLAGVALNALIGAGTSFVITLKWVRWEVATGIIFWMMGGLDTRTWDHVWLALPCVLVGIGIALMFTRELDVLLLGEEFALGLGIDVERAKRIILTGAALLTGTAVAVSGVVGFVGLIIPHIVRLVIGPRHRYLLPASALTGASFLVVADILARTLQSPEEIRLGIITAVFGAPFFLYLLLKHQQAANSI